MSDDQIRQVMVQNFGLRIQANMAQYVRRRLFDSGPPRTVAVIGGDARTGVAIRKVIALDALQQAAGAASGD